FLFFFSSRRRHTRFSRDWSSDVCSSDLYAKGRVIDLSRAAVQHAKALGGGAREVDHPALGIGAAVVDAYHHRPAVLQIGDLHLTSAERRVGQGGSSTRSASA